MDTSSINSPPTAIPISFSAPPTCTASAEVLAQNGALLPATQLSVQSIGIDQITNITGDTYTARLAIELGETPVGPLPKRPVPS